MVLVSDQSMWGRLHEALRSERAFSETLKRADRQIAEWVWIENCHRVVRGGSIQQNTLSYFEDLLNQYPLNYAQVRSDPNSCDKQFSDTTDPWQFSTWDLRDLLWVALASIGPLIFWILWVIAGRRIASVFPPNETRG